MQRLKLGPALVAIAVLTVAAACGGDPSAPYFQVQQTSSRLSALDATSADQVVGATVDPRLLHGPVDRPDPKLTPGAVATSDLTAVCRLPKRVHAAFTLRDPIISPAVQQAVFNEYNIPPAKAVHYGLDFLVPLQLGGANVSANIWPIGEAHGVGFREKEILNIRLHVLVCERQMPLDQAQRAVVSDWVNLWLRFG